MQNAKIFAFCSQLCSTDNRDILRFFSFFSIILYTLPNDGGSILWYYIGHLCVCPSFPLSYIRPYFGFRMITWVNVNGFSPNLVCALILWRSGLGLLMGKFHQFWMGLSALDMSIPSLFLFLDDNLTKCQWIFTKMGVYIHIVENCILHHWGVQLILAYSWARPAILVVGKGRGGMFLFLLFLHFHSCSSFSPVPLFHLLYSIFYLFSPFLWETTENDPQGLTCR